MNFVQKRVRVKTAFDGFRVGLKGLCTADLTDENDVFAVYFDEPPIPNNPCNWISFQPNARKEHFEVIGENDE